MSRFLWIPWKWWRRIAQAGFLLAFLFLFRRTEYVDSDTLPLNSNWLFRIDPLVAASAMLATKTVVLGVLIPAAVVLVMTALLGRFFCGWVCPLGTMLDWFHRLVRPIARRTGELMYPLVSRLGFLRHALLVLILVAAVFSFPLIGYLDPFAILMRGMTMAVDPGLRAGAEWLLPWLSDQGGPKVSGVSEPVLDFIRAKVLTQETGYSLAWLSLGILAAVFAMEFLGRRMWCRVLCPVGGMLGLVARFSLVKRLPVRTCKGCASCADTCRMVAFDEESHFIPEACNLCMDCIETCPKEIATFVPHKAALRLSVLPATAAPEASRRMFLVSMLAGVAAPAAARAAGFAHTTAIGPELLRPPGVEAEDEFLRLCVRCGACMKVCPTGALQPILLQAGVDGMFSPRLYPRMGYCEYNCTLCGQVCPTGAIPLLETEPKQKRVMGKAHFQKKLCLPWAKNEPCIVCEEHCPIPDKAIKLDVVEVESKGETIEIQRPRVDSDLCIGCGICENKCPIVETGGESGIRVYRPEVKTDDKGNILGR